MRTKAHCFIAVVPILPGAKVEEDEFVHGAIAKVVEARNHCRLQPTDFISVGHVKHVTPIPMGRSVGDAFQVVAVSQDLFWLTDGKPDDFVNHLIEELKPHIPFDRSRPATVYVDGEAWPIPGIITADAA